MFTPVIAMAIGILLRIVFRSNASIQRNLAITFVGAGIIVLIVGIIKKEPIIIAQALLLWMLAGLWYGTDKMRGQYLSRAKQPDDDEGELSQKKLMQMQEAGNKQVVSEVCKNCKKTNYKLIPENVVMGGFTDCVACGEMTFFPSPQSPFKEGKERDDFEKAIKDCIH